MLETIPTTTLPCVTRGTVGLPNPKSLKSSVQTFLAPEFHIRAWPPPLFYGFKDKAGILPCLKMFKLGIPAFIPPFSFAVFETCLTKQAQ